MQKCDRVFGFKIYNLLQKEWSYFLLFFCQFNAKVIEVFGGIFYFLCKEPLFLFDGFIKEINIYLQSTGMLKIICGNVKLKSS